MTGITEAAKSRTPMLIVAAEVTNPLSNFYVDQPALAGAVGAVAVRVASADTTLADTTSAYWTARHDRRPVVLNLPLDVQRSGPTGRAARLPRRTRRAGAINNPDGVGRLAAALSCAERPVFVAGQPGTRQGCRGAGSARRAQRLPRGDERHHRHLHRQPVVARDLRRLRCRPSPPS